MGLRKASRSGKSIHSWDTDELRDLSLSWHYPPPPQAVPKDWCGWRRGRPLLLGAGRSGWLVWNSVKNAGSRMSSRGTPDLLSGYYPFQSIRYSSWLARRWASKMEQTAYNSRSLISLCSSGYSFFEKKAHGWSFSGLPYHCDNTAPYLGVPPPQWNLVQDWGGQV